MSFRFGSKMGKVFCESNQEVRPKKKKKKQKAKKGFHETLGSNLGARWCCGQEQRRAGSLRFM